MVATGSKSGTATQQHCEKSPLAKLSTQEAGMSSEIELMVIGAKNLGVYVQLAKKEAPRENLQVVLLSKIANQYC